MKKSKILLSAVAAAVFATSAGALVACGDGIELPNGYGDKTFTITFDANGGTLKSGDQTITVGAEGITGTVPTAERTDYTFKYWTLTKDGSDNIEIKFDSFTDSATVYAKWEKKKPVVDTPTSKEYKITFDKGDHGILDGDLEVTTVKGVAKFPTVTADKDWEPNGWKDTDGKTVDESTVFTKDITVTAQYKEVEQGHETPDEEYTITFVEGMHGTLEGETEVTTVNGLVEFPNVEPDEGWIFDGWLDEDGDPVTASTIFTKDTIVIAQYTEDEEEEDPDPEALDLQIYVNGTSVGTFDSYDKYLPNPLDDRDHDYGKTGIELNKDDVISFKLDGADVEFWGDGYSETIDGLVSYVKGGKNTSVTAKGDGTYDFYLKHYPNDGTTWVLDVQGEADVEEEDPDPETLTINVLVNGTSVGSLTSYDAYLEDHDDGRVHDFGNQGYELNANDVVSFTLNGTTLEFYADGYSGTLGGLVTYEADVITSVTVKSNGTYDFYLKQYDVWVLDVQGEADVEEEDPDDPDALTAGQYIKVGDEYRKLTAGTPDTTKDEKEYYNVQVELTETTTIKLWTQSATGGVVRNINALKINGADIFGYNQYGQDGADHYDLEAGSYNIHYKVYNSGWVELDIKKSVEIGDAIVISAADAGKCATITAGGKTIKLYIMEGDQIVDLTENEEFRIYAWSGLNTAGYPGTVITSEMDLTGTLSNVEFLINKGGDSTKTGDLGGINGPGVYVITYAVGGGSVAAGVVQD